MKLSLRSKLLLLILPLLGVLTFLFFTALLPYQRVKTDINDLRPDVSKTVALGDFGIALGRQMTEYFKLIASGGAEDRFQEARNNSQQSLERLRKEIATHTGSEQDAEAGHAVEEIAGQYAELNRLCQTGLELAKSDQRDKALNLIKTKIEPLLEDSLRIKFEQLDAKSAIEFEENLARLRGHSDNLLTFSRGDLQSNITNMKGHITDTLLVFTIARNFSRQMEEYYFLILAQSGDVDEIGATRKAAFQALESWKINEGGGLGQRATANKDLEAVENVERELIKLNQLADPIPDLARRGETAQALHVLADKIEPIAHGQLADILGESVRHEGQALAESLDSVNKRSSQMQFGLGVFSLLVLVIGLGTPWLLSKTIISPILELKSAASKIGSGDLDTKVSVTSKGELSHLATTFNQMTEALKESRDSLHEANRELEQKVSDRTVELKDSNELLQVELIERKLTEAALRESEKKYRAIFENAGEGIFQTTPEGQYISANPTLAQIHGFATAEEFISSRQDITREVYVDPARREEFKRLIDEHGLVRGFEHQIFRKDGSKIWISVNARAVGDHQGAIKYYEGTAQDITERKRAEEKVQSLARFPSENPSPVLRLGRDGMISYANSASRLLLQDWGCAVGGRAPLFWQQEASEALASQTNKTIDVVCGDITFSIFVTPIVEADYVNLYGRDITERKGAEEALRQSEVYFRSLIEHAADTISTYDANGVRLYTSPSIERVLGYKPEEMIGRSGFELLHPDDRPFLSSLYAQAVQIPGTTVTKELRCRHKDGTWRTLESTGSNLLGNPAVGAVVLNSRDITERRRAEEALRESEERYRDLVENSREMICTHDLDGRVLSANRAVAEALGYDSNEVLAGKSIRDALAPEVRHEFEQYIANLRERGATSGVMLVETSTGERRMWEYYNSLRTEGVATPIVRAIARDITEQRRSEEAMSDLRRELELTMNSMEEGVHRADLKGNIVFENPAAARMLGWEINQLLGKPAHPTMHHTRPDGTPYPTEECPIYATLRDGVSRHVADEVFWRQDGTSFPVEYQTAPMRNDRNEIISTVVTFRDITERKRAEAGLRESEERYRELFENARDALYVHDLSGRYTSFNRAAEQLSGYPGEEIVGKHYSNFVAPESLEDVRKNLGKKLDEAGETTYEIDLFTKDRRRVPVEVSSRLIYENGKPVGVQGVARDITDRKRAQEALQTYSRRLIEAHEAERKVIARELHDEIGQVLTAVRTNLQLFQSSTPPGLQPQIDESLGIVDEALDRVRELSLDLRPPMLDNLGLNSALRWYIHRYAQRSGIVADLKSDLAEGERLRVEFETACFRIVQEALTNVARHARATHVSVHVKRSNGNLDLSVIDNGAGFNVDALIKDAPTVRTLGLRGMEERAVAAQGHLKIHSAPMRGTEVRASFPLTNRS